MATSSRPDGATGVVLPKMFGLLALIISFAEVFVSSPLSVALKCARHVKLYDNKLSAEKNACKRRISGCHKYFDKIIVKIFFNS